jgi:neutral ceramidase
MDPSHEYSELRVGEKLEVEHLDPLPKSSRWSKLSWACIFLLSFLTSFVFVVGVAKLLSRPIPPSKLGDLEWLVHTTRDADGQYLLGVGKADITGYVRRRCSGFRFS